MDRTVPPISDSSPVVAQGLWNEPDGPTAEQPARIPYVDIVFEQYKVFVEMADRLSSRRNLTNTFFLGLNTTAITVLGIFWQKQPLVSAWWLLAPLIALLVQCVAWYWLMRSYRQLNSAKFAVIVLLEERLPAAPFRAEWELLDKGVNWKSYLSLTHLEQVVPVALGLTYIAAFVLALSTN
ncbi:hypothetical protein [Micromonospora sp. B006]|uniref:RipA family octameric membrane protein n=1 Tax=Micromonospora sp. B006 TaxID=2201999 RepID=UPI000E3352D9|nr:hypothetical protein [Micromonospora sp. B006]AXO37781.1 hypothetical protein MicB006_5523 [Micromonospora sp. B006]